jgi:hypothetical protein
VTIADYPVTVAFYGPKSPDAWDGADQHFMESITNNARYYGVRSVDASPPGVAGGLGFTDTSTSSAAFTTHTAFVRPGMVVVSLYVDAEATNKAQMGVLSVAGTTVTELSRTPYPSQTGTSNGFIRGWMIFDDNPTVYMLGSVSGGTPTVELWTATVSAGGVISSIADGGAVTYPAGSFPGGGANYLSNVGGGWWTISDRLAFRAATWSLWDRLNPNQIKDAYAVYSPVIGGAFIQQVVTAPRIAPGRLLIVQRNAGGTATGRVVEIEWAADGSSVTITNSWNVPAATGFQTFAGYTSSGKVVAYTQDAPFGDIHAFYDVFGTAEEYTPTPGVGGQGFITPTVPDGSALDSWIVGNGSSSNAPMALEQYLAGGWGVVSTKRRKILA